MAIACSGSGPSALEAPAVQKPPLEVAATGPRKSLPVKSGLVTRVQVDPSQCRTRFRCEKPSKVLPTAHALVAELAVTPATWPVPLLSGGVGDCCQAVPFQCRITGCRPSVKPAAHAFVVEVAATAPRLLNVLFGIELSTCCQAVPFQCRISVVWLPPAGVNCPTAQASVADVAATPDSSA